MNYILVADVGLIIRFFKVERIGPSHSWSQLVQLALALKVPTVAVPSVFAQMSWTQFEKLVDECLFAR